MENDKKFIRKYFYIHQYEKEELFLSKMAREGWHFVKLHKGLPTKYEFTKGEPIDYCYQLDYISAEEDTSYYHQLFQDAGWEKVFSWDGAYGGKWYYYRIIPTEGKESHLYTDTTSKLKMYDLLTKKYGLYLVALLFIGLNPLRSILERLPNTLMTSLSGVALLIETCLFLFFIGLYAYMLIGIVMKKMQITKEMERH